MADHNNSDLSTNAAPLEFRRQHFVCLGLASLAVALVIGAGYLAISAGSNARLWQAVKSGSNEQCIRAAAALAESDPDNDAWQEVNTDVVTALVSVPSAESKQWIDRLRPVGTQLFEPLQARYRDRSLNGLGERAVAAAALAVYLKSEPHELIELILLADNDREFQPLLRALRPHQESASLELRERLSKNAPADSFLKKKRDDFWKEQANVAVCLMELREPDNVWPLLEHTYPSLRSFIIDRFARLGADHQILTVQLAKEVDPSIQQALILALSGFETEKMSNELRRSVVDQIANLYRTHSDSGIHAAAGWTLRQWQQEEIIADLDAELQNAPFQSQRNWFRNSQGQTFAVVEFRLVHHQVRQVSFPNDHKPETNTTLSHRFAIAAQEVTAAQFQQFRKDRQSAGLAPDGPVNNVSWYDAAAYSNWLSQKDGIPQDQWCYEPNKQGEYAEGMKIPADFLQRAGYRLPTEAEWEFSCRAQTSNASYSFGEPVELLDRYAWYHANSQNRMRPGGLLKPNGLGLFDMHGNAWEWSHDLLEQNGDSLGKARGYNWPFGDAPMYKNWERLLDTQDDEDMTVENRDLRVTRGGACYSQPSVVSSLVRNGNQPTYRDDNVGFRPARSYP